MIEATFTPIRAGEYRSAGGPWSGPSLDALLGPDPDVAAIAGGLRALGVHAGAVVTWRSPNRREVALAYRACWRIGAIAAPVHHQFGDAEAAALVARLAPTATLDLDALPRAVPVDAPWDDNESLAAVLFTSGSSGTPKGALHTQATLAYKASMMRDVHRITSDDVVLMPAPCAHISGLLNGVTLPAIAGARTVFMARWDPERALDLIEAEGVTFMIGPPTFFVSLMGAAGFTSERVRSLRLVSSGGAGVTPAFVERARELLGARVKRTYGSTEAPTVATSTAADDETHDATHDGRAIGAVELTLAPDGELLVRGPEVCVGYIDPSATAAAFDRDGRFHTGDLATIDPDGWLTIVGRKHDVIIRGGENIAAAEIEAALESHPAVRCAAVIGEPDDRLGERVCAAIVTDGSPFDVALARSWFAERGLARYKVPERIEIVDALPLLASGKPDKARLRTLLLRARS